MSGRMLLKGNPPPPVHYCDPPGERSTARPLSRRQLCLLHSTVGMNFENALWECDCGQTWRCRNFEWRHVTPRKARKILKRAARL